MARPAQARLDLAALRHNVGVARALAPRARVMAVVKANAYGHGAVTIAGALQGEVDALAVACIEEALELRFAGIDTPILLLEGVFSAAGQFVPIPDVRRDRAEEFWQERVFALLLNSHKIDEETAASMRDWRHSGFSVDTSVRVEGNDRAATSRLVGYVSRSPLSLSRMVARSDDGTILYRASHAYCWPFPKSGEQTVMQGIPRNHEAMHRARPRCVRRSGFPGGDDTAHPG